MERVWLCCGVTSDTWPEGLCGTADWQEVWDEAADTQPGLAQCLTTMNNAGGEDWAGPRLFRAPGDEGGRGVGFCSPPSPRAHLEHLTATDERVCGVHVLRFYHKFQLWPELCWLSFVSGSPAWPWDLFHRCAQNCATALWVSLLGPSARRCVEIVREQREVGRGCPGGGKVESGCRPAPHPPPSLQRWAHRAPLSLCHPISQAGL